MAWVAAGLECWRQALLTLLRSRMLWLLLAAMLAIAALAMVLTSHDEAPPGRDVYAIMAFWLYLTVLAPWSAMFFGVQAVHGDLEDRTFQYLFLRPVPRPLLLLGKWAAAAVLCTGFLVPGLALLFVAVAVSDVAWDGPGPEWRLLPLFAGVAAVASCAYTAVAALFGAWFRRPMIWAVFYVVGLEYFVANLPPQAGVRSFTIADPVRRLLLDGLEPGRRLARALWPGQRHWDPDELGNPAGSLALVAGACLLLALWRYGRSEYDSRARD